MNKGILKKAVLVVVFALVSTHVQAGWCPNWLNVDSAKDTVTCKLWPGTCDWVTSQGNNLRTYGNSAWTSFDKLDPNYKILIGTVGVAGFLYVLYKVKNKLSGKSTKNK